MKLNELENKLQSWIDSIESVQSYQEPKRQDAVCEYEDCAIPEIEEERRDYYRINEQLQKELWEILMEVRSLQTQNKIL